MTLDAQAIDDLIRGALPGASVAIETLRDDGTAHYALHVISESFSEKTRVQQHRIVYAALKGHMDFETQPLTLRTSTPP